MIGYNPLGTYNNFVTTPVNPNAVTHVTLDISNAGTGRWTAATAPDSTKYNFLCGVRTEGKREYFSVDKYVVMR